MSATVEQVADAVCVDPADVVAFLALYPAEVTDLWEEPGVLSRAGITEVHDVLDPHCERTVPQVWGPVADDNGV